MSDSFALRLVAKYLLVKFDAAMGRRAICKTPNTSFEDFDQSAAAREPDGSSVAGSGPFINSALGVW